MTAILRLMRVHQWLKNGFIFAAPFFGGRLLHSEIVPSLVLGFAGFCLLSSAVYILNDIVDVESDRLHPEKRKRPLASGEVKTNTGVMILAVLLIASLVLGYLAGHNFLYVLFTYALINIGYSFYLKKIAILDIILVSSGFILRVLAGGLLSGVVISHWLYIMTFLLALFLAIAKRRDDLVISANSGTEIRKSVSGYNLEFVNIVMGMMASVLVVSYILYVTSPEITSRFQGRPLFVSAVFVFAGLLRYLQITMVYNKSGSPTMVLIRDIFIQICILGWILYFAFIIYFVK